MMKKLVMLVWIGCGLLQGQAHALFLGYTEPYRMARMSFPETGVIVELPVREGTAVQSGEILARLDYQVLQTELNIAREQLRIRQLRFEKLKELQALGSVSPDEFERARADLYMDEERAKRIEAQIENRTLRAPFDCVVVEIKREISESVSSASTHVLTVVQLNRLLVNLHLSPAEAFRLSPQEQVDLTLDEPGVIKARVDFVSPVIDAASNTVRVRFLIENPQGEYRSGVRSIYYGMTPTGTQTTTSESVVTPPESAEKSQQTNKDSIDPIPPARNRPVLSPITTE